MPSLRYSWIVALVGLACAGETRTDDSGALGAPDPATVSPEIIVVSSIDIDKLGPGEPVLIDLTQSDREYRFDHRFGAIDFGRIELIAPDGIARAFNDWEDAVRREDDGQPVSIGDSNFWMGMDGNDCIQCHRYGYTITCFIVDRLCIRVCPYLFDPTAPDWPFQDEFDGYDGEFGGSINPLPDDDGVADPLGNPGDEETGGDEESGLPGDDDDDTYGDDDEYGDDGYGGDDEYGDDGYGDDSSGGDSSGGDDGDSGSGGDGSGGGGGGDSGGGSDSGGGGGGGGGGSGGGGGGGSGGGSSGGGSPW